MCCLFWKRTKRHEKEAGPAHLVNTLLSAVRWFRVWSKREGTSLSPLHYKFLLHSHTCPGYVMSNILPTPLLLPLLLLLPAYLSLSHTKKNKIFLFRLTEYLVREKIDILSPGYCICCQGKWVQHVELPVELISRWCFNQSVWDDLKS